MHTSGDELLVRSRKLCQEIWMRSRSTQHDDHTVYSLPISRPVIAEIGMLLKDLTEYLNGSSDVA